MKTTFILKAITAAALLAGTTPGLLAEDTAPVCPFGYQPGTGRTLTPEQRADHIAAIQAKLQELRQKREANTITDQERAWLDQVEQRGGLFLTGTPRGPRGGGIIAQGLRQGPRDGAGPRGGGIIGQGRAQGARDGTALGGGRGHAHGLRDAVRRAGAQGLRHGLRDGRGPRAIDGTCPLGNVPQRPVIR